MDIDHLNKCRKPFTCLILNIKVNENTSNLTIFHFSLLNMFHQNTSNLHICLFRMTIILIEKQDNIFCSCSIRGTPFFSKIQSTMIIEITRKSQQHRKKEKFSSRIAFLLSSIRSNKLIQVHIQMISTFLHHYLGFPLQTKGNEVFSAMKIS